MTINSGSVWATSTHSYGLNGSQNQTGGSSTITGDYASMMQNAVETLISAIDTDKSGTVDKTEFSQAAQALAEKTGKSYNDADTAFTRIDSNSDGSVSADELLKALQEARNQKKAHHAHRPPNTEATESSAQPLNAQTEESGSDKTVSLSRMQSALLQRVMEAYSSNGAAGSSTTLATA